MHWKRKTQNPHGRFTLREAIEIDAEVQCVFACWSRLEAFPRFMDSVRRIKHIDDQRVLWDVDISGRQVVWEARIVESIPEKSVRWESSWGADNSGEVRFDALPSGSTRLTVEIDFRPRNTLERLGGQFGLVDDHVRRDLERFRDFVQTLPENQLDRCASQRRSESEEAS